MSQYVIHVNMKEFSEKWEDYADNIHLAEAIRNGHGSILTLDSRPYYEWLTTFAIFYVGGMYRAPAQG